MLHTIKRPADAPGPHLLTLEVLGGSFPFERGAEHEVELDPEADLRLIIQLRRDGYLVVKADGEPPAEGEPERAAQLTHAEASLAGSRAHPEEN